MKIFLIGMPGAGKSTVGRILAEKIAYNFIDLDGLVEKNSLMFTDELIEKYGINKFRELETEALQEINEENVVVSCGGGIVENRNNKTFMSGLIIYLDVDNKIIEERLKTDYQRPLLQEYTLDELYTKRFLLYQHFADINISNNKEINNTVDSIIQMLEVKK
ncbi:shikimate kinase [Haploplasma axanthum]|uniref:Shikimate kinase n=1 Tax=Haploplasma axanthum TaxID=29552 RepID=A0A449BE17_HAPAX|nr:shikimate kinase [Haploplasma axanthum]VEU80689.1 Shikimate kinase [Haploplasma axanthum]